jgi:hypothetical protein
MNDKVSWLLFDKRDHELIRIVNDVLRGKSNNKHGRQFYYPYFHPHGIKRLLLGYEFSDMYTQNGFRGSMDQEVTAKVTANVEHKQLYVKKYPYWKKYFVGKSKNIQNFICPGSHLVYFRKQYDGQCLFLRRGVPA